MLTTDRRLLQRVSVSLHVVLRAEDAIYVLVTDNLSEGGLFLSTKKGFPVGTSLHMTFGMPPELPKVNVTGSVRRMETDKGVGVVFTSLSPTDKQLLREFLNFHSRGDAQAQRTN
jgi:Tfp pilus assembly protein PilZ